MKKYFKRIMVIFAAIVLLCSFSTNSIALQPPAILNHPSFSSYEEMMEAYYDNSRMWSDEVLANNLSSAYWELPWIDFDEYCSLYNAAIESNSFVYFTEHPDRLPHWALIHATWDGGYYIEYDIGAVEILVDFPQNEKEELEIEKENIKGYIELSDTDYFDGCDGCRKKLTPTDSIVINNQECICLWEANNRVKILYDNRILTVNVYKIDENRGELTAEDYIREFLSDLVFSEYIPPEGGGETGGEVAGVE